MTDDDNDIEILPPEDEVVEEYHVEEVVKPRRGVGYPVFLLGLLFASALGAAGGGAAAYYLNSSSATPSVNLSPVQSDIANLEAAVSKLENAPKAKSQPAVDISSLEARINALETAPTPTMPETAIPSIDPDMIARLEALQSEGSGALDLSAIEQRLDSLETAGLPEGLREDVQDLFERLAEWEISLEDFRTEVRAELAAKTERTDVQQTPVSVTPSIPFPKAAMLSAVEGQPSQGGFFKRAMNKHIQVKDEDNPAVMIDAIAAAIARGDIDTAKSKFDQLPSTIRSAGQDWRNSLK